MSSDRSLNVASVHIIKDSNGFFNTTAPAPAFIDCRSKFDSNETINTTTHGTNCGGAWEAGELTAGAAVDTSTDTIATVKMRRYINGQFSYIWITPADYATFITKCNSCCGS